MYVVTEKFMRVLEGGEGSGITGHTTAGKPGGSEGRVALLDDIKNYLGSIPRNMPLSTAIARIPTNNRMRQLLSKAFPLSERMSKTVGSALKEGTSRPVAFEESSEKAFIPKDLKNFLEKFPFGKDTTLQKLIESTKFPVPSGIQKMIMTTWPLYDREKKTIGDILGRAIPGRVGGSSHL